MTKKKERTIETLEEEVERKQFEILNQAENIKRAKKKLYDLEVKKNKEATKRKDHHKYHAGGVVFEFVKFMDIGALSGLMISFLNMTDNEKAELKKIGDAHIASRENFKK